MFYWPWGEDEPDETLVTESGKLMLLDTLVPALFKNGHKVLIFSQFTKQLDILEEWASTLRGWNTCRIDGSVKQEDRREQIKSFNTNKDFRLFLLSTRAGGLGINLTSADTVILFDSDWVCTLPSPSPFPLPSFFCINILSQHDIQGFNY